MTDYESPVQVQGYETALGTKTYRTISGAVFYDHTYMGRTHHTVIHQAVEIPDLKHHMLCPMHVCTNRFTVNDFPILLTDHPTEETHDIIADYEWCNNVASTFCLSGFTSYLLVCLFTDN